MCVLVVVVLVVVVRFWLELVVVLLLVGPMMAAILAGGGARPAIIDEICLPFFTATAVLVPALVGSGATVVFDDPSAHSTVLCSPWLTMFDGPPTATGCIDSGDELFFSCSSSYGSTSSVPR